MSTAHAQTVMNPESISLATVYAQALLDTLPDRQSAVDMAAQLQKLTELIHAEPDFSAIFGDGALDKQSRIDFVEKVFAGRVDEQLENLIGVLAANNRLVILPGIARQFIKLLQDQAGEIAVKVTSAAPLDDSESAELSAVLEKALKAKPILQLAVDPELLGGITLQVGDAIYDASVAGELASLAQKMSTSELPDLYPQETDDEISS